MLYDIYKIHDIDINYITYNIYVSNVYVIKYSAVPLVFEATCLSVGVQSQ